MIPKASITTDAIVRARAILRDAMTPGQRLGVPPWDRVAQQLKGGD
jgi:hypothetical protein